jgi:hypothetical protein
VNPGPVTMQHYGHSAGSYVVAGFNE